MERQLRDFLGLQQTSSPFQDHPHPPKGKYTWKSYHDEHREVYHLSLTTLHLDMIETTWEQVDITALGSDLYLWLKNIAKIYILIHTPCVREWDCRLENRIYPKIHKRGVHLETCEIWQQNSSDLISPLCKWVMTRKMTNSQWTSEQLTIWPLKSMKVNKSSL